MPALREKSWIHIEFRVFQEKYPVENWFLLKEKALLIYEHSVREWVNWQLMPILLQETIFDPPFGKKYFDALQAITFRKLGYFPSLFRWFLRPCLRSRFRVSLRSETCAFLTSQQSLILYVLLTFFPPPSIPSKLTACVIREKSCVYFHCSWAVDRVQPRHFTVFWPLKPGFYHKLLGNFEGLTSKPWFHDLLKIIDHQGISLQRYFFFEA